MADCVDAVRSWSQSTHREPLCDLNPRHVLRYAPRVHVQMRASSVRIAFGWFADCRRKSRETELSSDSGAKDRAHRVWHPPFQQVDEALRQVVFYLSTPCTHTDSLQPVWYCK